MLLSASTIAVYSVVGASILLMLARPRGIAEVWWASAGALLLVILGLIPLRAAAAAVGKGSDVYFFLTGMMLFAELAREQGVFDWLASLAIRSAHRSPSRFFTWVYGVGTIVTIFMSNDATAVVLTPAILAAVRKARTPPLPYLFVCAIIANAASFVLPISNPANLVVFQGAMPSLSRWLLAFGLPSLLSIGTTYFVLRWIFRRELARPIERDVELAHLPPLGRSVLACLGIVSGVLLAASAFGRNLGLPTLIAALAVTAAISVAARASPVRLAREVSWSTLALVAALFVFVEAVVRAGALDATRHALAWVSFLPPLAGVFVAGFAVGLSNNLVNNLPLGLMAGSTLQGAPPREAITHAILIGIDIGPNLAITGSLATTLWILALRKENVAIGFWQFFKVGLLVMPAALAASLLGSLLIGAWVATP